MPSEGEAYAAIAKRAASPPDRHRAAKAVALQSLFHISPVNRNHCPIAANFVADDTRHALQQGHTCRQKSAFEEQCLGGQLDDKRVRGHR